MKNAIQNMSKNTKIAIGAVVLVIIVALVYRAGLFKKTVQVEVQPEPTVEQTTTVPKTYKSKPVVEAPVDTRSYTELITAYKGRTVQFGNLCQNHINNQVFKVGSEVLLDNRNNVPVNIKIGNNVYNLSAYGHEIVSLNTLGEFLVDCNAYQNVTTIIVQK